MYSTQAYYEVEENNDQVKDIRITVEISLLNNSEQPVVITDVVGILKYNKELYDKQLLRARDVPSVQKCYDAHPSNRENLYSFIIQPHESKTNQLQLPWKKTLRTHLLQSKSAAIAFTLPSTKRCPPLHLFCFWSAPL